MEMFLCSQTFVHILYDAHFISARLPDFIPGLKDRKKSHVVRKSGACEVPVHKTQTLAFVDERLGEARRGRNGAYSISDTKKKTQDRHS